SFLAGMVHPGAQLMVGLNGGNRRLRRHMEMTPYETDGLLACFAGEDDQKLRKLAVRDRFGVQTCCDFFPVQEMPLTDTGIADRDKLAVMIRRHGSGGQVPPRTGAERMLANIWQEVLGIPQVGVYDDFFESGGHSLLATQVILRIEETFQATFSIQELFKAPTVAALAEALAKHEAVPGQAGKCLGASKANMITPVKRSGDLPLSFGQERMWFVEQLAPGNPAYNIPDAVRFTGSLKPAVLERVFQEILRRHEVLRTAFTMADGKTVQVIAADAALRLPITDLQRLPAGKQSAEVLRLAREEALRPFDLRKAPLLRVALLRLALEEYVLLATMHHIVSDGWSLGVFRREMTALYQAYASGAPSPLPELPVQYADFTVRQRKSERRLETQRSYWIQQLAKLPPLNLPTDRTHPPVQSFRGARHAFKFSRRLTAALNELSRQSGASLFMTLLAGFAVLLSRYSNQDDVAIGSPIACRNHKEIEALIGFFVNTLVFRVDLSENPDFRKLLGRVRKLAFDAYANQDLPFEQLVEELHPQRDLTRNPLVQAVFAFQNTPAPPRLLLRGLRISPLELDNETVRLDLEVHLWEIEGELRGHIDYCTDLFDAGTVARMAEHFRNLLEGAAADPERRIWELPLLSATERRRLLAEWNNTDAEYPRNKCIHQLFEAQAERSPDATAAVFQQQSLTYRELNARASQLAHFLRGQGVGPEVLAGICMERSLDMIVGVLGILKAGGAYVPLDPAYPKERLAFMQEDSQVSVLLTQKSLTKRLSSQRVQIICIDTEEKRIFRERADNPVSSVSAKNQAYVIYTSGSTGRPKGVSLMHQGLCNLAMAQIRLFDVQPDSRLLQFASLSFDASIWEIVMALCSGARLCMGSADALLPGPNLLRLLEKQGVTHVMLPPSALAVLPCHHPLPALRTIVVGGEACSPELAASWSEDRRFFNAYGPTESTVCAVAGEYVKGSGKLSIGRPIANTRVYILDAHLQPVPVGVSGELHIGGVGLARGYLNRPELTEEKFISNPFDEEPGARLYKTGDLARYLPDGRIEFLGRMDNQVKIRGFRIESGEIETMLALHPDVREAVAVVREDTANDKRLVAYVVPDREREIAADMLRDFLKQKLPAYMIPSSFAVLEAFPLTPNGKIDRKALPVPEGPQRAYVMPQTELEQIIAVVWQEVLSVDKAGIHDNFFDLGGHSLLIARTQARLQDRLAMKIPMVDLFKHPSIHALARHLSRQQDTAAMRKSQKRAEIRLAGIASNEIAVIGMAGRWPGAENVDAFWRNLRDGVESIRFFEESELLSSGTDPAVLKQPDYVRAGGVLSDIERFDAAFFDISPKEAETMDPQQRLFLECAQEAIENAGYDAGTEECSIGVYAGTGANTYLCNNLSANRESLKTAEAFSLQIGNGNDFLPTRVSYKLNLSGPSINVQTACSTSLTAVHLACQALRCGECDIALAGGVSVRVPHKTGYLYQEGMILSPDGHCRAFDAKAQGTVGGNGMGIVVLKRLADAISDGDCIHAVIKGSATNNDGSMKVGYTAPGVKGQTAVISEAQAVAGVAAESISYVETHGTGTALGDPIEITALSQAFNSKKSGFCAIGSVKTNIGHTDTAAGATGLIKTILALKHRLIPPSLHFTEPNPDIDFADSPFYVNTELSEWKTKGMPRRAGVSSFGIGGTNAHIILEEAPASEASGPSRSEQLLTLSARTQSALDAATANMADCLKKHPDSNFADAAYTLNKGRKAFNCRRMLVCKDAAEAENLLSSLDPSRVFTRVQEPRARTAVFMFPGQGAQHVNMGRELYLTEAVFREQVDKCSEYLKPHLGFDLRRALYPGLEIASAPSSEAVRLRLDTLIPACPLDSRVRGNDDTEAAERLNSTEIAQPAVFVIEYAFACLWMKWGVRPSAMIGHSIGEYVAACLAGVFSLEDALALVAARGRMMRQLPGGAMLAVPLSEKEAQPFLGKKLSLAAVNAPSSCVVSGTSEAAEALQSRLAGQGVECRRLRTYHAFHSVMMEPVLEPFAERVKQIKRNPPQLPWVSNVTGSWISAEESASPAYWARHLRQTVRFADGMQRVLPGGAILLEVGPGQALSAFAKQHPDKAAQQTVLSSLRRPEDKSSDVGFLLNALGRLWLAGWQVDWPGFYADERRH
ncbi:MAG: amino acid adenylation domain-containing protein, partial [Gammaproteobacteria bacterium]|nr:amino acid adenylation domain-containing protein [Gammaproteobacteria bacterium]